MKDNIDDIEVALANDGPLASRVTRRENDVLFELIEGDTADVIDSRVFSTLAAARAESRRVLGDTENRASILNYLSRTFRDDEKADGEIDEDGTYLLVLPLSKAHDRLLIVRMLPTSLGPASEEVAVTPIISTVDGLDTATDEEEKLLSALESGSASLHGDWIVFDTPANAVSAVKHVEAQLFQDR